MLKIDILKVQLKITKDHLETVNVLVDYGTVYVLVKKKFIKILIK